MVGSVQSESLRRRREDIGDIDTMVKKIRNVFISFAVYVSGSLPSDGWHRHMPA